MNLTPEQQDQGRRNFIRVLAGTPALLALGVAAATKGPVRGGPVRLGFIGLGGQGRVLLEQTDPRHGEAVALCDVNPLQLAKADESLVKTGRKPLPRYADWKDMIQKERLEAVVIASPLFTHTDIAVGCMEAGLHVLCEKMMGLDDSSCRRMAEAARKTGRVLEIGHQRFYNPVYQAAYEGIVKAGLLGEVFHARLVWHRNGNWRRTAELPSPDYSAAQWGYPTYDHLVNWRLYKRYSRGHMGELASHMVAITDWFFGAPAEAAIGAGGVHRYRDGREVPDHTYVTLEYPGGRTALFTSIESNQFDDYYEAYYGTKGTLILKGEVEAYLFEEGGGAAPRPTGIAVAPMAGPAGSASESRAADAAGRGRGVGASAGGGVDRLAAYRYEVNGLCGAVRTGAPLQCGPERGLGSALACIAGFEAIEKRARIEIRA
ncbi:MAG TPA: Gfo/Idh/MocA family oxidoreductase [Vicinamibacteria bacterium]